jgi:hypothetical protein
LLAFHGGSEEERVAGEYQTHPENVFRVCREVVNYGDPAARPERSTLHMANL